MSIPTDRNISVKVNEKLSKYKDLEIEIERMWGMKAKTIPVVIGALGLVKKGMEKFTQQIPGNIKIQELQKITLLGTSHILRKALSINDRLLSHSNPRPKEWARLLCCNRKLKHRRF